MNFKFGVILLSFLLASQVKTKNIFGLFSSPSLSHFIFHKALIKELVARGHNVTIATTFPTYWNKSHPPNFHEILLKIDDDDYMNNMLIKFMKNQENSKDNSFLNFPQFIHHLSERSHAAVQSKEVQGIMHSGTQFDLFILGYFFNDFQLGLAGHFRCPSVVISSTPQFKPLRDLVASPSGIPVHGVIGKSSNEVPSFLTRMKNVGFVVFEFLGMEYIDLFKHRKYYELNFPAEKNYPRFDEVRKNVSLVLINSHFSDGAVRASHPNLREVGGIQAKYTPDPLPENLKVFLDGADEHGAILFTLGSNLKSTHMSKDKLEAFFNIFGRLKQRVVWKWEGGETPTEIPKNILLQKWLPQDDILAHRNVRLFISHCGLGGVTEAKFHGVPILGIPVFADQPQNALAIVDEGWALHLPYANITEETLSWSINELISNRKYAEKAKELSNLFRDRPMKPLDEAVFWTEYVMRHNGARHMQSKEIHLNFIQRNGIDVIAVILIGIYVIIKLIKVTICGLCRCLRRSPKVKTS